MGLSEGVGEGHDPQVRVMSRDANNDTLCIQSQGLEPCSQRIPERPQKQRITTVRWPPLGAPGRAQRTPKGPPGHPWGTEGAAKTAPNKNPETLSKKHKGQELDTKKNPKADRYLRGFCAHALREALFGDAAARRKHKNMYVTAVLDPRGAKTLETPIFY